jgi:hypothetical protein
MKFLCFYSCYKREHNIRVCHLGKWKYLFHNTATNLIRPALKFPFFTSLSLNLKHSNKKKKKKKITKIHKPLSLGIQL